MTYKALVNLSKSTPPLPSITILQLQQLLSVLLSTLSSPTPPPVAPGPSYMLPPPKRTSVLPSGRMLLPTPCMLTHVVCFSQCNLSRNPSCHISVEALRAPGWFCLSSFPSALGQVYLQVVVASLAWGLE